MKTRSLVCIAWKSSLHTFYLATVVFLQGLSSDVCQDFVQTSVSGLPEDMCRDIIAIALLLSRPWSFLHKQLSGFAAFLFHSAPAMSILSLAWAHDDTRTRIRCDVDESFLQPGASVHLHLLQPCACTAYLPLFVPCNRLLLHHRSALLTHAMWWQVWAVMPSNLVEAERKGAQLLQRLAEAEAPASNGSRDLALTDATNNGKKVANGHKEAGV